MKVELFVDECMWPRECSLKEAKRIALWAAKAPLDVAFIVDTGNIRMRWVAHRNRFTLTHIVFYKVRGDNLEAREEVVFGEEYTTKRLVSMVKELLKVLRGPLGEFALCKRVNKKGVEKVVKECFGGDL
jgi:hypothetical protein